jgi:hypothetical protein
MAGFEKRVENKREHYLISLNATFDDHPVFMDISYIMRNAIERDGKNGYLHEAGPFYGIEHQRALDYAGYVEQHLDAKENLWRFDTRHYRFFVGSLTQEAVAKSKVHHVDV